jgi:hypothetical protein
MQDVGANLNLDLQSGLGYIFQSFFFLALACSFLFGSLAFAEYRAFELKIENSETGASRSEITTLDHLQYPKFYPLQKNERVGYVDSWMCRENTSHFKKICPKPDRSAASVTKRPDVGGTGAKLDSKAANQK